VQAKGFRSDATSPSCSTHPPRCNTGAELRSDPGAGRTLCHTCPSALATAAAGGTESDRPNQRQPQLWPTSRSGNRVTLASPPQDCNRRFDGVSPRRESGSGNHRSPAVPPSQSISVKGMQVTVVPGFARATSLPPALMPAYLLPSRYSCQRPEQARASTATAGLCRRTELRRWWIDFYGHQVVAHLSPAEVGEVKPVRSMAGRAGASLG
jgi:hypothetical protein